MRLKKDSKVIETAFREIFSRQWYTNQGPMAQKLEVYMQETHGVKHAIAIANEKIARLIIERLDEAFSGDIYSTDHGAIVLTDNEQIANKIRNIRSSYGAPVKVNVPITGNGRMSEAQAVLILLEHHINHME